MDGPLVVVISGGVIRELDDAVRVSAPVPRLHARLHTRAQSTGGGWCDNACQVLSSAA